MKPERMIAMVKKLTNKYGVDVQLQEPEIIYNERGIPIPGKTEIIKSSKVLLLKEKFNPIKVTDTGVIGISQDYARYILTLPEVEIKKDMVITDNHNMKWKLGPIDWFDVGEVAVCKQADLLEVS
jgi:hypothetical protein